MSEPTTQAGKRLVKWSREEHRTPPDVVAETVAEAEREAEREAAAAERERLLQALAQAESDLLAYGHHLEGEIVYRGADWQAHRLPGETCRCGLDAAIARVHAALGGMPQGERARAALAPAAPVQEDSQP